MEDYRNMERCSGEPCCVFAERICADNEKEILKMTNEKKQELDALCLKFRRTLIEILHERQTGHPGGSLSVCEILTNLYLAELIDFTGIVSCLAVRGTLSERMTDKLTDSIAGMADEVLEKWEDYQDKTE